MAKPLQLSRETRIYLAIWRKAYGQSPEPLEILFPDAPTARSFRMALYRALKPYRDGQAFDDTINALIETHGCGIEIFEGGSAACSIGLRRTVRISENVFTALEFSEDDLRTPEELEILKLTKLSNPQKFDISTSSDFPDPASRASNPFFKREE